MSSDELVGLGYEQIVAMRIMRDRPDQEASAIAKAADCAWLELYELAERGFIDVGMNRLIERSLHPTLTEKGRSAVAAAEAEGIL